MTLLELVLFSQTRHHFASVLETRMAGVGDCMSPADYWVEVEERHLDLELEQALVVPLEE